MILSHLISFIFRFVLSTHPSENGKKNQGENLLSLLGSTWRVLMFIFRVNIYPHQCGPYSNYNRISYCILYNPLLFATEK